MPESYSLNDLFTKGLTKEQLKAKFLEAKNNADIAEEFSIFTDGNIEESLDGIFAQADTTGDGSLDENEIANIKNLFQDDNQDTISENDIRALYQQALLKQYGHDNPESMYQQAMSRTADIRESDYISQLDNSLSNLENFITNRQAVSTKRINQYQDEINEIVLKAARQKNIDTNEYNQLTQTAKNLQASMDADNVKLLAKQRELENAKNEAKRLEKELKELKSDPEKNKVDIEAREFELNTLQTKISNLTSEISGLKSNIKSTKSQIKDTQKALQKKQREILQSDRESEQLINILKNKISLEQRSAESDISGYNGEIKFIQNARNYAVGQISRNNVQDDSPMEFRNSGDAITKNQLQSLGLKYSSEKGQKLAEDMRRHAVGFTGYCSRHVSNGLERTGLGHERMASAHMMDTELDKNKNFKRIQVSSLEELKSLPAGCIVVYEANAAWNNGFRTGHYNATHGHIEVTLGDGTAASDGITRNLRYSNQMSVFIPVEEA